MVGRHRQIAAQIMRLIACAAAETREPELPCHLRRHAPAGAEAILQTRVLIVNIAQDANLAFEHRALRNDLSGVYGIER